MLESKFQNFAKPSDASQCAKRLAALRAVLKSAGVDGFIVPRADEHQGEYVPPGEERLAWLAGFTGSAGLAIVLSGKAPLFADGRYTTQARKQTDNQAFSVIASHVTSPEAWLKQNLGKGIALGYDARLLTDGMVQRYEAIAKTCGARLVALEANPIDAIWLDRPAAPLGAITQHPLKFAGETAERKIARVGKALRAEQLDALVVSDPHSVAWLMNIRGADIGHTPLPLSYALVPAEGRPVLFADGRKFSNSVRAAVSAVTDIEEPSRLAQALVERAKAGQKIRLDAASAGASLKTLITQNGGTADVGADPIALMKAPKNAAEIRGARAAHLRDGLAICRFLAWLDREAPKGKLTEIDACKALETFRRDTGKLKQIAFPTIAGAGPNSALPHYRSTERSNRRITSGIFLCDSGAQYEDGTTDITRTIAVGKPSAEMKDRNTRVLKGHIAIARAVFPEGTSGAQIDAFARQFLWEAGLDFDHGTGHGIGSYLSVHEGPHRISKLGHVPLQPGMLLSNEPGFYAEGKWGIRIENLLLVERRKIKGGNRAMLGFETLTLAPIDKRLIDLRLLTPAERAWLNAYHSKVYKALAPGLDQVLTAWLRRACARL